MAHVKQTQARTPSPSSSSTSETPSPPPTLTKRVPIPTHKILAKDKGKAPAPIQEKTKKRKEPPTEKFMADAMKEISQKRKKKPNSFTTSQESPRTKGKGGTTLYTNKLCKEKNP